MQQQASRHQFRAQMLVKRKEDGKKGVVVDEMGFMRVCSDEEVPVVFEGTAAYFGTDFRELELLGKEDAVADFEKCGGGKGAECCKFLAAGARGFTCERFGSLRNAIIFKKDMAAKREPTEMFPNCQIA